MDKKVVVIESPYAGKTLEEIAKNILFARACLRDSLLRGEVPFASHLLYTQPGILNDDDVKEKVLGINAGLYLVKNANLTAVYDNLGISEGMEYGIKEAKKMNRKITYRTLDNNWEEVQKEIIKEHSHKRVWDIINKL